MSYVLLRDLPVDATIGYDSVSLQVRRVHGVREIPGGAHLIWAAESATASQRSGVWFVTADRDGERKESGGEPVVTLAWEEENAMLTTSVPSQDHSQDQNVVYRGLLPYDAREIESQLASTPSSSSTPADSTPFPRSLHQQLWKKFTGHITQPLLTRIIHNTSSSEAETSVTKSPAHIQTVPVWSVTTVTPVAGSLLSLLEEALVEQMSKTPGRQHPPTNVPPPRNSHPGTKKIPYPFPAEATKQTLHFTLSQAQATVDPSTTGASRTAQALDTTEYLLRHAAAIGRSDDDTSIDIATGNGLSQLLGELQFAFVTGMHLGNESCMEQWRYMLVDVFLRAYDMFDPEYVPPKPKTQPQSVGGEPQTAHEHEPFRAAPSLAMRSRFVVGLFKTLHAQIEYDGECLEGSIMDYENTAQRLRIALTIYTRRLHDTLAAQSRDSTEARHTHVDSSQSEGSSSTTTTLDHAPKTDNVLDGVEQAVTALEGLVDRQWGWNVRGHYVREGPVMLEDGETVDLDLPELEEEDERGEYACVVVELDEHGRQKDLVSWD